MHFKKNLLSLLSQYPLLPLSSSRPQQQQQKSLHLGNTSYNTMLPDATNTLVLKFGLAKSLHHALCRTRLFPIRFH